MLLSIRYGFLMVHVAKTGGTSVRAALDRYKWRDPYRLPMFLCSRLSELFQHRLASKLPRHAKAIAAKEMLPAETYASLFKFAFVRNPWDLQVSAFHHLRRERPAVLDGREDFESFLRHMLDPHRAYQYHLDTFSTLQSDYVIDLHGEMIVDFVGRYERLDADFARICDRIGIPPTPLPHTRRAQARRHYHTYYTPATVRLVRERFAADVEMFGYSFE